MPRRRRAACDEAHGPCVIWGVYCTTQLDDRLYFCFFFSGWERFLAILHRSLDRFPPWVFLASRFQRLFCLISKRHVDQHPKRFSQALDWGLRLVLLIGVPAALGLMIYAMPLIASCFAYGHFSTHDVTQTQRV